MKRFLALALSLLMLFSLVACSGNTAPAADADNTQQTEATAPKRSQANRNGLPTTLQFPAPFASGFPSKVSRA